MRKIVFILASVLFFIFPSKSFAQENQFVTIVNPVRISPYTENSSESIKAEYEEIKKYNLPATWLLRYEVLKDGDAMRVIKDMDNKQEIGIFLEVIPELTEDSSVTYPSGASWHHANAVFLSGYLQEERKKMIDVVFEKFKNELGYYPTSVGSWWTDSYSLSYMKEKYGVTANLTCSDQFSTDGYQIWGQYWMYPYLPSKYHTGMPAVTKENQLDVVVTQWAPRDPLNGYYSSLYSTQDYHVNPVNQNIDYFKKLVELYNNKHSNSYGHITIGLEGDFNPGTYSQHYRQQMTYISDLYQNKQLEVLSMKHFSDWYRNEYSMTPITVVESNDLLDTGKKVAWFQSNKVRLGFRYDTSTKQTTIFDLRIYNSDFQEPYYETPNHVHELSIMLPSFIDEIVDKESVWNLEMGEWKSVLIDEGSAKVLFEKGEFELSSGILKLEIGDDTLLPSTFRDNSSVELVRRLGVLEFAPKDNWIVPQKGIMFKALSEPAMHELQRKRTKAIGFMVVIVMLVGSVGIFKYTKSKKLTYSFSLIFIFSTVFLSYGWYSKNTITYNVSQAEVDALTKLKYLSEGSVLVYDKECLGCSYAGVKPAVFANKRDYVAKYSGHKIVQNQNVFDAKIQEDARKEFEKTRAKYIYVTKYVDTIERVPFSPGDLNIEKVYSNANAEVWKVKE